MKDDPLEMKWFILVYFKDIRLLTCYFKGGVEAERQKAYKRFLSFMKIFRVKGPKNNEETRLQFFNLENS